jgi:hypothetical protein
MHLTWWLSLAFVAFIGIASESFANRVMLVPSYARRVGATWGAGTVGQTIGYQIHFIYRIVNPSTIPQSGTITFMPGSTAYANQDTPTGLRTPTFSVKYLLCSQGGTSTGSGFALGPGSPTSVATASWSVAAGSSIQIGALAIFRSTYNIASPGHNASDSIFEPVVKMTVNEDQGAILTTEMTLIQGVQPNSTYCDGSPTGTVLSPTFTSPGVDIPLLVNGGRPF